MGKNQNESKLCNYFENLRCISFKSCINYKNSSLQRSPVKMLRSRQFIFVVISILANAFFGNGVQVYYEIHHEALSQEGNKRIFTRF